MYAALRPLKYYERSLFPNFKEDPFTAKTMADVLYHILAETVKDTHTMPKSLNLKKVCFYYIFIDICCFTGIQCRLMPHYYSDLIDYIADMIYKPYYVDTKGRQINIEHWRIPLDGITDSNLKARIEYLYIIKKEKHIFDAFEKP